jgi:pyruvate/2-oxoacid:ferredoxin oxidoreductase alpha subunit
MTIMSPDALVKQQLTTLSSRLSASVALARTLGASASTGLLEAFEISGTAAGSHVPYKSLVELRAIYMPDVARSVSGHPPN